jgi:hypothetical protein
MFSSREFSTELRFCAFEGVSMWHVLRSSPPHQAIGLVLENVFHFRWFSGERL